MTSAISTWANLFKVSIIAGFEDDTVNRPDVQQTKEILQDTEINNCVGDPHAGGRW